MKPDAEVIAEVRELDAKATPEPWISKINHAPYKCVWFDPEDNYTTLELKADDADFIAAARTLLPDLANRLEAANSKSEWRPISEAPKDGTRIIYCDVEGTIYAGCWDAKFHGEWDDEKEQTVYRGAWTDHGVASFSYKEYAEQEPVAWMPLPEPPTKPTP